eukprot:SM000278S10008  [mRNA]  locus=s278:150262:153783:+ [translate_table: standard]
MAAARPLAGPPRSTSARLRQPPACRLEAGAAVAPGLRLASQGPPYNVLITGGTKGVGLALAREFLREGDSVLVCSRSGPQRAPALAGDRVESAVRELQQDHKGERVWGTTCDVSVAEDVEQLAAYAKDHLDHIDIWINNAGSNAYTYKPLIETDNKSIAEIVETNTLGVMLCCRQAIRMMREQPRGGHIFNMDGAGSDGNATPRFAVYGATKRSLAQFTKSLQAELKMLKVENVVVHNLSPGMVTTDLLMSGGDTRQAKFFINALAEPADKVAEYLVPRIRQVPRAGVSGSTYIRFLTGPKAYVQILGRLLYGARKSRYLPED